MEIKVKPLPYDEQMALAETIAYAGQSKSRWRKAVTTSSIVEINGRTVLRPQHATHILNILEEIGKDGYADAFKQVWSYRDTGPTPDVKVEPLTAAEDWRLTEFAGDFYDLPCWVNLAIIACSVREIDGNALEFPKNRKTLRERVKLLGWNGMEAAAVALNFKVNAEDE